MEKILFRDRDHRYTRASDGMALMSVSHMKKLFEPTDWDHTLRKAAAQEYLGPHYARYKSDWERQGRHILDPEFIEFLAPHMKPSLFQKVQKAIRKKWDAKRDYSSAVGTQGHAEMEAKARAQGEWACPIDGMVYPFRELNKKEGGDNESVDLRALETGYYPELLLYYLFPEPVYSRSMGEDICGIAGQTDMPFINRESGYAVIGDFKFTDEELSGHSIQYKNLGTVKWLDPFHNVQDTKLTGYNIQLSTYAWLLENTGLECRGLFLENYYGKKRDKYSHKPLGYLRAGVDEAVSRVFIEGL